MSAPIVGSIAVTPRAIAVVRRFTHFFPMSERRRPVERISVLHVEELPMSAPLAELAKVLRRVTRESLIDDPEADETTEPAPHTVVVDVTTSQGIALSRYLTHARMENHPIIVDGETFGADERGTIVPPTELAGALVTGVHEGSIVFAGRGADLAIARAAILGASADLAVAGPIAAIAIATWAAQTIARGVFHYAPRVGL